MKMSDTKTVPTAQSDTKLHTPKSKKSKWVPCKLLIKKRQNPIVNTMPFKETPTTPKEMARAEEVEENRTATENQKSVEEKFQKTVPILRRREERRTGTWSQPGSPRDSLLLSPNPTSDSRIKHRKIQQNNNVKVKKWDPLMGISIIIVILIITLIWGRFCAILCTSAWLFFISRYRSESKASSGSVEVDLDSEEYKKKVVFEGFLKRDHRAISI